MRCNRPGYENFGLSMELASALSWCATRPLTWCGLLFACGMLGQTLPTAKDVTVRLVNVRTGQAVANQEVSVQFHTPDIPTLQHLVGKTSVEGTVKFRLPKPVPATILVMAAAELYPCYSLQAVETNRVLQEGFFSRCSKPTQGCRCKFGAQVLETRYEAGEVVLPVRPFTRAERVLGRD